MQSLIRRFVALLVFGALCAYAGHIPYDSYSKHLHSSTFPTLIVMIACIIVWLTAHFFRAPKVVTNLTFTAIGAAFGILVYQYLHLGAVTSLLWLLLGLAITIVVVGGVVVLNLAIKLRPKPVFKV